MTQFNFLLADPAQSTLSFLVCRLKMYITLRGTASSLLKLHLLTIILFTVCEIQFITQKSL
jgi:hypothetical protein